MAGHHFSSEKVIGMVDLDDAAALEPKPNALRTRRGFGYNLGRILLHQHEGGLISLP
jgi:hypothetical protein